VSLVSNEERPLMAAIERLMNRKVESRVIEGFEPGSAPRHDESHRQERQERRPQQRQHQRRGQPQQQPRHNGQRHPRGSNDNRGSGRPQQRPQQPAQPTHDPREDQIREARARMAAEGEKVPPRQQGNEQRGNGQRGNGPRGNGQRRNAQRGNGRRFDRSPQADPRRSESREPAYAQTPKPNASRPVVVIQKKRSFTGMVAALLGKKRESEPQE